MQLLIDLIKIVLLFFIKIGDFVLFVANLIVTFFAKLFYLISYPFKIKITPKKKSKKHLNIYSRMGRSTSVVLSDTINLLKNISKPPKFSGFEKNSLAVKKVKHIKPVVIFPFPFLLKLKYFSAGIIFSLIFIFFPLMILFFVQDLPNPEELTSRDIPQTTKIYDRNGALLYQIYANQNRTLIPISQIPKNLINATISIEDKDFYNHPGFDVSAIIRSLIQDVAGSSFQGGSTITQQLIKSALLSPETSLQRKVKEIVLAFWAERIYNKTQILEMYFNQVPYGGTAWGIESAAQVYFNKHAKDLDLAQSSFLAGIPRAPTIYSPYGLTPNLWKTRQREVLGRMVSLGYITKAEAKDAEEEKLNFMSPQTPINAPYFVMYIKDFLVRKYGLPMVEKGGLSVKTSLDLKTQNEAQRIVADEIQNDAYLNVGNGAALITNPTNGDILAMVGGKDYEDQNSGNVNLTTAIRQPGSSIKIVTYSAALSNGFTAATILDDSPVVFNSGGTPYAPVNYDGKFHGKVPLRIALGNSFNIPAVKTLNQIGIKTMFDLGKQMGIKTWTDPSDYGLSITLGGADVTMLDMASVYNTEANAGIKVDINPILKITDSKNNILEEKQANPPGKRVLGDGVAYIISNILSDNSARIIEFGSDSPLNIPGYTVSVKTGTSDNKRDNWTIGYTPSKVVTVWVGNNDNSPMSPTLASGITGAAPIWNKIMTYLIKGKPDEKPKMPSSIVVKPCFGRNEFFIKGTESSVSCAALPSPSPSPQP